MIQVINTLYAFTKLYKQFSIFWYWLNLCRKSTKRKLSWINWVCGIINNLISAILARGIIWSGSRIFLILSWFRFLINVRLNSKEERIFCLLRIVLVEVNYLDFYSKFTFSWVRRRKCKLSLGRLECSELLSLSKNWHYWVDISSCIFHLRQLISKNLPSSYCLILKRTFKVRSSISNILNINYKWYFLENQIWKWAFHSD